MSALVSERHLHLAAKLRETLQTYLEAEELINIGAYVAGSNRNIDSAIEKMASVRSFLRQKGDETFPFEESLELLGGIFG